MSGSGRYRSLRAPPPPPHESLRRRIASWAGQEDRPPVDWFPTGHHHHHGGGGGGGHGGRADSSDTASMSSRGRCDSGRSTPGDSSGSFGEGAGGGGSTTTTTALPGGGGKRSRKRDWFKVLLAARNLATCVYAMSYTTTMPVLPFMANRLIYPRDPEGAGDPGSEGVREAWRGMAYGLVMSGYYLTKMISAPWIGFLSDRMGRRQALVVTLLGGALSFLVTKLWGQYSIHGLIMCRLLMGCFAANGALMHAYIRDTVSEADLRAACVPYLLVSTPSPLCHWLYCCSRRDCCTSIRTFVTSVLYLRGCVCPWDVAPWCYYANIVVGPAFAVPTVVELISLFGGSCDEVVTAVMSMLALNLSQQ